MIRLCRSNVLGLWLLEFRHSELADQQGREAVPPSPCRSRPSVRAIFITIVLIAIPSLQDTTATRNKVFRVPCGSR